MTPIRQFIDAIASGNKESSEAAFNSMIMDRVRTNLDVKSVELASATYSTQKSAEEQS